MKILTYRVDEKERLGFLSADGQWVYETKSLGMEYRDMKELIRGISPSEIQLAEYVAKKAPYEQEGVRAVPFEDVTLLAPVPEPGQDIICLGVNYLDHLRESREFLQESESRKPEYPVYFGKRVNRALADQEEIPPHSGLTDSLDYETELAVIIGREARNVPEWEAASYIFGYTILNDVSARNLQSRHGQWYLGKSLDGFAPMGPWIVTADEIAFPPALSIRTRVNGALVQDANTADLIFGIAALISDLSQGMTLRPGTILSTGTPSGTGVGRKPPCYLKPGDTVECEIEGIGTLTNRIGSGNGGPEGRQATGGK